MPRRAHAVTHCLTFIALATAGTRATAQRRAPNDSASTRVTGTVLGSDGRPLRIADVRLLRPRGTPITLATAQVDSAGHFAIATTARGTVLLWLTGLNHEPTLAWLQLGDGAPIGVDARLTPVRLAPALGGADTVKLRSSAPGFGAPRAMTRDANGRWTLDAAVAGDTVPYTLIGLARRRDVTDPDARGFMLGGLNEPYQGIARTTGGRLHVVVDPSRLAHDTTPGTLVWHDSTTPSVRYALLLDDFDRADEAVRARPRPDSTGRYGLRAAELTHRETQLATERDPALRQLLVGRVLALADAGVPVSRERGAALLAALDLTAPAWGGRGFDASAYHFMVAAALANGRLDATARDSGAWRDSAAFARFRTETARVLASNAPDDIKAAMLETTVRAYTALNQPAAARATYAQLAAAPFAAASYNLPMLRTQYDSARTVAVGRLAPRARFTALDGNVTYGPEWFAAHRLTLVDFWAVWCGPCVTEVPNIAKVYAKYRRTGFAVLSVSLDADAADVRRFRRTKEPMPWAHAWAAGGFENETVKQWQVGALPRAVLVDGEGRIVAAYDEVRGERLGRKVALPVPQHPSRRIRVPRGDRSA